MENILENPNVSLELVYRDASNLAQKTSTQRANKFFAVKESENTPHRFDVILSYPCLAGDIDDRELYLLYLNGHLIYSLYNTPVENYDLLLKITTFLVPE